MLRSLTFLTILSLSLTRLPAQGNITYADKMKLERAVEIISSQYVDQLEGDEIITDAIVGVLKQLDPHSTYIPADDLKAVNEELVGNFEGVGIQFNILEDTILVVWPIPDGPSEKLGIQAGDKIVYIEDENVAGIGMKNQGVIKRLRGPKGTKVNVRIKRSGASELLEYRITRDKIPLYSIDASFMVEPEIGYIRLSRFQSTSANEFKEHLAKLQEQGMQNLILDLRNNHGGYLNVAIDLADEFLNRDKLIVFTEGEHSTKREFNATSRGGFEKGKLAVLVDDGSASASEIVSGAVQDWDRGLVIGRRTFGKGLVQREYGLPDGSAMRITVARYHTPTGRCIQKPYDEGLQAYRDEITDRYRSGEFLHGDSLEFPDSLKYYTPNKRTVYGGGGIMPDIFVPLDTTQNSEYSRDLLRRGVFTEFALNYVDDNRAELLSRYPDVSTFAGEFDVKLVMPDFKDFGDEKGVPVDEEDLAQSEQAIEYRLKALIARNLWTSSAYFQVINEIDPVCRKAVEAIKGETFREMGVAHK